MVGDIKQSIYGFRGAEPSIFAGYRLNGEIDKVYIFGTISGATRR